MPITAKIVDRIMGYAVVEINGELQVVNVEVTKDEIGKLITFFPHLMVETPD